MDVTLAMIADYANVTADGKLNVMGIFDRIRASAFPAVHPLMQLVVVFTASPAEKGLEKSIQVRLLDEDGQSMMDLGGRVTVPDGPGPGVQLQHIYALQMLQFQRAGTYAFHILVNEDTKRVVPLMVEGAAPLGLDG
jgi:hypothetical protein